MRRATRVQNYAKGESEEHIEDAQSSFKLQEDVQQNEDGPKVSKKFWTKKQDEKLIQLVEKYGQVRWTQISMEMSGRSAKRCRERWMNYLDTSKNHSSEWTNKEKWVLFLCYKVYGNKWSKISKEIKRGDNIIKNQVNCLKRKKMMPYEGRLRELLKQQNPIAGLTDACELQIQLVETLKSRTKTAKNQSRQITEQKNQSIRPNIAFPIPKRPSPSGFHPLSAYSVQTLNNMSNLQRMHSHGLPNIHNPLQHSQFRLASIQQNSGNPQNPMFFPPLGFFPPFGFFY